jgi:hypothetical protein
MGEILAVIVAAIAGAGGFALYIRTLRLRAERETRAQIETERGRVVESIRARDAEIEIKAAREHSAIDRATIERWSERLTPAERLERIRERNRS